MVQRNQLKSTKKSAGVRCWNNFDLLLSENRGQLTFFITEAKKVIIRYRGGGGQYGVQKKFKMNIFINKTDCDAGGDSGGWAGWGRGRKLTHLF